MSELHDRLMTLANRGAPRGVDTVFDAASRAASLDVIDGELETIPFATPEPERERARRTRRPFGSMIAAAGLAGLLVVGMLAVSALVGSGGAGSPEGAVRRLADAISHGDPLAAASVLAPTEVGSLRDTVDAAEKRAQELRLVQHAAAPLAGLDLSVNHLQLRTEPLADGYAKVIVERGTLHAQTQHAHFSPLMQKVLRDSKDNSSDTDLAQLASSRNLPTFVVAVRQDGHWYVSAAYTTLEYIRENSPAAVPAQFGSGLSAIKALGADSPDDAVQQGMRALAHNDWDTLFKLAPPDEIPVYDYRDFLKQVINESDAQTNFTLDHIDTTSHVHGNTADVVIHASGTTESGSWSLDGGCFQGPSSGDGASVRPHFCVGGAVAARAIPSLFGVIGGGADQSAPNQGVTAVKRDGRWFISPVSTVLGVANEVISHIEQRTLYAMLGIADQLPSDGRVTLGQPVTVTSSPAVQVRTIELTAGESLLGQEQQLGNPAVKDIQPVYVQVYAPEGRRIDGYDMFAGDPGFQVDTTGTYKLVFSNFTNSDAQVTIWPASEAPTKAHELPDRNINGCVHQLGVETCASSVSGGLGVGSQSTVTPTSVAHG